LLTKTRSYSSIPNQQMCVVALGDTRDVANAGEA
jgi:hypothetical protein